MEQQASSSPRVIRDHRAAQLLVDLEQLRLVLPFMGRERSISEVARELGLAVDAMTYRVKKLVRLGLLEIARREPRKGRAINHYRAALAFFVPVDVLPHTTTEELYERSDAPLRRQIARSMIEALYESGSFRDWGVLVRRDAGGNPQLGLAPRSADWNFGRLLESDAPALLSSWMPLTLDFEDAKALQAELFALIEKYAPRQGSQRYLLGVALAPE